MLQYTNAFSCAINEDSGEVFIRFLQETPSPDKTSSENTEPIADIIMSKNMAQQLKLAIADLLNNTKK